MQDFVLNFKLIFLLVLFCVGCGVKGPPVAPPGTTIPSITDQYMGVKQEPTPTPTPSEL